MNKKVVGWVVAFAVIAVIGAGFALNRGWIEKPQHQITIGAVLPMTGALSFFGEGDNKALMLLAEENPDVHFIVEDSKGTPKDGLSAIHSLLSRKVRYFITSLSYIVNTVQPVLDDAHAFNMTLNMDIAAESNSKYCGRLYVTFHDEMDALVNLAKSRGANNVAVIYSNVDTMNKAVNQYLRTNLSANNVSLYAEAYDPSTKDFRDILAKVDSHSPQILRILDFGDKLPIILRQISEQGRLKDVQLVSGIETLLADYAQFPPDITSRFIFTCPELLLSPENPTVKKYREKYRTEPTFDAIFCYDIGTLLISAVRKYGYDHVDDVIQHISSLKTYRGAAAVYSVSPDRGFSPAISWAKIEGGKIEFTPK